MAGNDAGLTGRGVRVAVIDSGVHVSHPHISRVAGGVTIGEQSEDDTYVDLIGHGTAVTAAIQEKAPEADYFVVRVFQSELRASVKVLIRALEWSIDNRVDVINLSLGSGNPSHAERFAPLLARVGVVVSAREVNGYPSFPGSLPGVIGVGVDWDLGREDYACRNVTEFYASGYPRPIPGVPKERNLHGVSFAVANMTGFVVRACERLQVRSCKTVCDELIGAMAKSNGA
jgi:subtilase family protein